MQINIDLLNLKTVDKAIKQIEQYHKRLQNLIPDFLVECANTVAKMANANLASAGYESDLVSAIQGSWKVSKTENGVMLENEYEKAVYVEFGTGVVGSGESHEMASESGYEYDINGHGAKGWRFVHLVDEPIDVPKNFYSDPKAIDHTGMWFTIHTKGAPATMFLYNAATNFIDNKEYERVWKQLAKDL